MLTFENHPHWNAVQDVFSRLRQAGFKVLLAGGCVRDFVMQKKAPNDFDIATNATPDEVSSLFPHALTVGKAFGVTIIPFHDFQLEVATFREDLEYKDGRRPEGVRFSTPKADACRRDFTVNALFYDIETEQIVDYVGGQDDIKARIIRTVGDPSKRFEEDKLRILRAIRFAAQLGFEIDPLTLQTVIQRADEITVVSRERIRDELAKLLKSEYRLKGLRLLVETGLLKALFPKLNDEVSRDVDKWLKRFEFADSSHELLSWSLFFYPVYSLGADKEFRESYLRGLRLDNHAIDTIGFALKNLEAFLKPKTLREGELIYLLTNPAASLGLKLASIIGQGSENHVEATAFLKTLMSSRLQGKVGEKPEPFLSGEDLKILGVDPGPRLGAILHEAFLLQLEGRLVNRSEALEWLRRQVVKAP